MHKKDKEQESTERRRVRPVKEEPKLPELTAGFLNTARGFWDAYRMRPGSLRRQALLKVFQLYPTAQLPVNNKWQANTVDPDLAVLLKKGILKRDRNGGVRRHPMNKSSSKRQTYLVLA